MKEKQHQHQQFVSQNHTFYFSGPYFTIVSKANVTIEIQIQFGP